MDDKRLTRNVTPVTLNSNLTLLLVNMRSCHPLTSLLPIFSSAHLIVMIQSPTNDTHGNYPIFFSSLSFATHLSRAQHLSGTLVLNEIMSLSFRLLLGIVVVVIVFLSFSYCSEFIHSSSIPVSFFFSFFLPFVLYFFLSLSIFCSFLFLTFVLACLFSFTLPFCHPS